MTRIATVRVKISLACLLVCSQIASAQFGRGGAEWVTQGGDPQRTFSIPTDAKISSENMQKPGFEYLWKKKLNNESVQLNSLTPAVLIDRYIGYRGFRSLAFLGGSSNMIYAIDTDLSRIEWQTRLPGPPPPSGSLACPGGLSANIARPTSAAYPVAAPGGGGLGGRGGPARSGVGEVGEGAVTIGAARTRAAAAATANGGAPARPAGVRAPAVIYAIGGEGMLHTMYISNGVEPQPPINFVPPNASAQGLTVIAGVAYAATANCNGASSGIWALDLASKQVSSWTPSSGSIVGSAGPTFGPDGTIYAATSAGELVALDPKSLQVKDTYRTGGQEFTSSPVVFQYKTKDLVAVATKDGHIQVLDSASLGGSDHRTALFQAAAYSEAGNFAPGALASWQGPDGARWILASVAAAPTSGSGFTPGNGAVTNGAVAAWKVVDRKGSLSLQPVWVSRDMVSPLVPMIINDVVFAVASGEYRSSESKLTATQRAHKSSPAVVYALDGETGKVLWDSGKTITSFAHSGGLSGGASQLYLQTYDQTIYAFGFPIEH